MSVLLIVESPNKVKTIAKMLGKDYVIRPTFGHICDLAKGKGGNIGVDIKNGFKPKYEVLSDKKDKIKAIIDAARTSDEILIASDKDKEGEAIAFHVADQLKKLDKPIKRIEFNEITKKAITHAINNPRDFDNDLFDAQQARRVLDRIVGFMVSPYLSQKLGDKLSAGRVQSVALRMIVDKEREIEAFVPETFYNLTAKSIKDGKEFAVKYPKRVSSEEEANEIKKLFDESDLIISNKTEKKSIRKAPPPLTTSMLQQEASTKLRFKSDKTMSLAQSLYEGGYITYIRTDSVRNSDESIIDVRKYLTENGFNIPTNPNEFKNKDGSQDAHEAIRPTHLENHYSTIAVEPDQKKLYELIYRTFVASQMNSAIFNVAKINIKPSSVNGDHYLLAEGKIMERAGWLDYIGPFVKKDKDVSLPNMNIGDKVLLLRPGVKIEKSQTKPPPRYYEASLIAELDRKDIGRPSTYASIISRISVRKYVKNTAKGFVPTKLGCDVIDDLKDQFTFMDYMYTAEMEKKLDEIAEGKLDYLSMMNEFFNEFKVEFQRARNYQGMITGIPCPKCGEETVVRKSKYGFFGGCVKYKAGCDGIVNIYIKDDKVYEKGAKPKIEEDVKCPECGAGMIERQDGRFGPFYSCSNYPRCKGKRKIPFGKKCSKCGGELYATLFDGKLKLACMEYPNCKNIEELPEGSEVNWVNPEKVTPPVYSSKVEKVLK